MVVLQKVVTSLGNQASSRKAQALIASYLVPALTHIPPKWRAVILSVASGAYIVGVAIEKVSETVTSLLVATRQPPALALAPGTGTPGTRTNAPTPVTNTGGSGQA